MVINEEFFSLFQLKRENLLLISKWILDLLSTASVFLAITLMVRNKLYSNLLISSFTRWNVCDYVQDLLLLEMIERT